MVVSHGVDGHVTFHRQNGHEPTRSSVPGSESESVLLS